MQLKKFIPFLVIFIILNNIVYADLVAHWNFNEGQGDIVYDSQGANDGTHYGVTDWTTDTPSGSGYGLEFDGINDYINILDDPVLKLGTDQTVSAWLKPSSDVVDWARIVGKGNYVNRAYGLWRQDDGDMLCQIYGTQNCNCWKNGGIGDNANIPVGGWHHVACTYDGLNLIMYIDGNNVKECPCSTTPPTSSDPVTIGYAGFHTYFNGLIDDVKIWNHALQEDEILEEYDNVINPPGFSGSSRRATGFKPNLIAILIIIIVLISLSIYDVNRKF